MRPQWLAPTPPARIPAADPCRARLYQTLVGVNEGAIYIAALPGSKRIVRPAVFEGPDNDFLNGEMMQDTYVQVETYLAGQQLYAPTMGSITDRVTLQVEDENRLTIDLDADGNVRSITCR